jgi:hypothetical protein
MKRFKFEQCNADIVSHSGLALVGQAIKRYTQLSTGKNDFEAINNIDSEFYLMNTMSVGEIRCDATLRQRMDKQANAFLPILKTASIDFLSHINPTLVPVSSGHIPIDADVTPMDNSGSHKERIN